MDNDLPVLAVVFTKVFLPVVEAAAGVCRVLWVIDSSIEEHRSFLRALRKFGAVVDVCGVDEGEIIERLASEHVDGVIAFENDGLARAATIAARLNLAYHSPAVVERLVDKVVQRRTLEAAGFAGPQYWPVMKNSPQLAIDQLADIVTWPVVVKPRYGGASRDTYFAVGRDSFRAALSECSDEDMIVESFLADSTPPDSQELADFVSVESAVVEGTAHHVAVTGRFPVAPPFRGSGMFVPSHFSSALTAEICDLAGDAALAIGVRSGFMHTEIKVTPDGPRIIELNGRVGGGVPDIIRLMGGPSLMRMAMMVALRQPLPPDDMLDPVNVGFYLWHQPPIGAHEIVEVRGLEEVAQLPGVREVKSVRHAGDRVDWHEGGVGHVFGVGGVVGDHEELVALRRKILSATAVDYR
jgi:biotin carboxylase